VHGSSSGIQQRARQCSFTPPAFEPFEPRILFDALIATPETVLVTDASEFIVLEGKDSLGRSSMAGEVDALTFEIVAGPAHGVLSGTMPILTYLPEAGYTGADAFTFTVTDGVTVSEPGTVTIDVAAWTAPIGIPEPEFGLHETHTMYAGEDPATPGQLYTYDYGNGLEAYRIGDAGPYTHYVDNTHPNATNSSNTFGTPDRPRLTIPNWELSAGSVMEIHGGPYTATSFGVVYLRGQGTADHPVFVRGASRSEMPRMATDTTIGNWNASQYVILENISFFSLHITAPGHHIVVRNSEVEGDLDNGGLGVGSFQETPMSDVVIYNNLFHDNGDWQITSDQDVHGIAVGQRANNLWVIDNEMYHCSGNGIQINAREALQAETHHIYVGRNIAHHNKQKGFATKQADDVIFTQNTAYGAIAGLGCQYAPERVWFLFNHVYDSTYGILSGSDSGLGYGEDIYVIGNLIHSIHHDPGLSYNPGSAWSNAGIMLMGGTNRHIAYNTIYDVDAGINGPGTGSYYMVNNIISNVTEPEGNHIFIERGTAAAVSDVQNSVLYQPGEGARIKWGSGTAWDLAGFQAQFGKGAGSLEADPLFVDADNDDFHLAYPTPVSPAVDAGAVTDYAQIFFDLYGLSIDVDFDGGPRTQLLGPDIGAFEAGSGLPTGDNEWPVAADVAVETTEDAPAAGVVTATDADGDPLIFALRTGPANGSVRVLEDGSFTYTPDADYAGFDSFTYTVYDGQGGMDIGSASVTVTGVDDAPVAASDQVTTNKGIAISVAALSNDSDADGDMLTVTSVTQPAHGTVVNNGDGTLTYTPAVTYLGADSFTYTVSDGTGGEDTGTVNVDVVAPGALTGANIGSVAVSGGSQYDAGTGVYAITGSGEDIGGTADEFQYCYRAMVGDGEIRARVFSVENTYRWAKAGVMIRETLDAGSPNALMAITPEMGSTFQVRTTASGSTTYTDALDGVAAPYWVRLVRTGNTLTGYRSSDGSNWDQLDSVTLAMNEEVYIGLAVSSLNNGVLCEAQFDNVTIVANGDNSVPLADNDAVTTSEDTEAAVSPLANDTDADGDVLFITDFEQPAHGVVVANGDDTLTYTPDADYFGVDSFTYTISDGQGGFDSATVTITVDAVQDGPVASDDTVAVSEDVAMVISPLANDTDADGDALTVTAFTQPAHGTLVDNGDGTWTYTPAAGWSGVDSFTYTVSDGAGGEDTGTVTLTVHAADGDVELIAVGDTWRYFKGTSQPPADWAELAFDDAAWLSGPSGIGYGDLGYATTLADMQYNYFSFFARRTFEITDPDAVQSMVLGMVYDDGFIAYVNGMEVTRSASMGGTPGVPVPYDAFTEGSHDEELPEEFFTIEVPAGLLQAGQNVLAIEVHNDWHTSNDAALVPRLGATMRAARPAVSGASLNDGQAQRSTIHTLAITFDEDVVLGVGALTLTNNTADENVPLSQGIMSYDNVLHTATWDLSMLSLYEGNYTATLLASAVTNAAGESLAGDYTIGFLCLNGDFTGDGSVGATDIDLLAEHIRGGADDSAYDLTGDGAVDSADMAELIGHLVFLNDDPANRGTTSGDANLDGIVDDGDLYGVLNGWRGSDISWANGDFTCDGIVDDGDLSVLLANWTVPGSAQSAGAPGAEEADPSPSEPVDALALAYQPEEATPRRGRSGLRRPVTGEGVQRTAERGR